MLTFLLKWKWTCEFFLSWKITKVSPNSIARLSAEVHSALSDLMRQTEVDRSSIPEESGKIRQIGSSRFPRWSSDHHGWLSAAVVELRSKRQYN